MWDQVVFCFVFLRFYLYILIEREREREREERGSSRGEREAQQSLRQGSIPTPPDHDLAGGRCPTN